MSNRHSPRTKTNGEKNNKGKRKEFFLMKKNEYIKMERKIKGNSNPPLVYLAILYEKQGKRKKPIKTIKTINKIKEKENLKCLVREKSLRPIDKFSVKDER